MNLKFFPPQYLEYNLSYSRTIFYTLNVFLIFLSTIAYTLTWKGSTDIHTMIELIATISAIYVGGLFFLQYNIKKTLILYFLGVGFIGTATLDGYHAIVTSQWFTTYWPSPPETLIPWSWSASRSYLSILVFLATPQVTKWLRLDSSSRISIFWGLALFSIVTMLFFALVPLPRAYFPEWFLGRPQELVPGVLFLVTLILFYRGSDWRNDPFYFWILCALVVNYISQICVMTLSFSLFDGMFDFAHLLKAVSYLVFSGAIIHDLIGDLRLTKKSKKEIEDIVKSQTVDIEKTKIFLEAIIESSTDGILVLSSSGKTLYVNDSAKEITGIEKVSNDILKWAEENDCFKIDKSEKINPSEQPLTKALEGGITRGMEMILINKWCPEGVEIEVDAYPVEVKGEIVAAVALYRDIEKRNEFIKRISDKNSELEQFAYAAAHDLQTPLRHITSYVTKLTNKYADLAGDDEKRWIEFISSGAQRMRDMINSLLKFATTGREGLNLSDENIKMVLDDEYDRIVKSRSKSKYRSDSFPRMFIDKGLMIHVFQNLFSNAFHYSSPERDLEIEVKYEGDQRNHVIKICDNGRGIAEGQEKRVFDIFRRGSNHQENGTGIGLSICLKIVKLHGGTMTLSKNTPHGVVVTIHLPKILNQKFEDRHAC